MEWFYGSNNATFINSDKSRTGIIEGNPIHKDMLYAARTARLDFIVNVVINSEKEAIFAVAGDCDLAHIEGRNFLNSQCKVKSVPSDLVITTNGGYPLDQNIYQAVKCMTAAEATINKGGVMIVAAKSNDGHGGEQFYKTLFARILKDIKIIYISDAPDNIVSDLHMIPAHSVEEAITKADEILENKNSKIIVIPDGVSVIVL